ncbi:MAG: YkvA family protein [Elusimicrobiota bacterium]|nr:YkvA family protein [Elusimicrobiota bacterium]
MLNAFNEQLKRLAADPKDGFTRRVRALAGGREAPRCCGELRALILAAPAMVARLRRWTDDAHMPPHLLRQQKFALAYLYSPYDFVPDAEHGLFGYLDDAWLVGSVFADSCRDLEALGLTLQPAERRLRDDCAAGLETARRLLPRETDAMRKLLSQVAAGVPNARALAACAEAGREGVTR